MAIAGLGKVIYDAWKMGAKFDAWQEHFNYKIWNAAFSNNDLNPEFYSQRLREDAEILPWDHIQTGVSKKYLHKEYDASISGQTTDDCRNSCVNCGILLAYKDMRTMNPGKLWKCPEIKIDNTYWGNEENDNG